MAKSSSSSQMATHTKTRSKASTMLIMSLILVLLMFLICLIMILMHLMRNKFGRVVVLYVESHHKRSKTCVWVPTCLVTNMRGPKQIWVPKNKS
jgi:hypothetical protein